MTKECFCVDCQQARQERSARNADRNSYQFTVASVKDIDLNMIVREQYERGHMVSLLTDEEGPKLLLIHVSFLRKFKLGDNLGLSGHPLAADWGDNHFSLGYDNRSFVVLAGGREVLTEARGRPLSSKSNLTEIAAELAAARAFVRKITVKVHTL